MTELIAIIIPAYNSEQTIGNCVKSVLAQTYRNFEIILVDDGSTDKTVNVCQRWAKKDKRVRLIMQEHCGASTARNTGLDFAERKGLVGKAEKPADFITFIDSDDVVASDYLETLHKMLVTEKADVAAVGYQTKPDFQKNQNSSGIQTFSPDAAISDLLYQKELDSSQCMKLFRREVLDGVRFREDIRVYEDLYFVYEVYKRCKKIAWCNVAKYIYNKKPSGQMDTVSPMVNDAFIVMDEIRADIENYAIQTGESGLLPAIDNRTISVSFNILKLLAKSGRRSDEVEARCWKNIKDIRQRNFFDSNVRIKNKLGILVSLFGKTFFKIFCKIFS